MPDDPALSAYPCHAFDKLRFADTDLLGHVNNSMFATAFETGRCEIVEGPEGSRAPAGTAFVIARMEIDFRREMRWPGTVEIGTGVTSVGRSSVHLDQALFQLGLCVARCRSVLVLMDTATRHSTPLPDDVRQHLQSLGKPAG